VYEGCLYGPWPCPSSLSMSNIKATVLILRFFFICCKRVLQRLGGNRGYILDMNIG
jgi:hypothetical protein